MLDLDLWIRRLESQMPDLRQCAGAVELASAREDIRNTPALWVIPVRDQAGNNDILNGVSQMVTSVVGLIFAVRNFSDGTGAAGHSDLMNHRKQASASLLGWQPGDADEGVELVGGRLLGYNDATVWWQDDYRTRYMVRKV